jgi:hypothetical protein
MRNPLIAGLLFLMLGASVLAGSAKGPLKRTNTVQGFQTLTYKVRFEPGKPAVVIVQGDGDSPLILLIVDSEGKRVTADVKNIDRPAVKFTPTSAEPYFLKIRNRGGVPNRFLLRTN